MDLKTIYDFSPLVNEAEKQVIEELGRQLEALGDERLMEEEFVLDMAAYALNHVTPRYRATLLGRLYASHLTEKEKKEIQNFVSWCLRGEMPPAS